MSSSSSSSSGIRGISNATGTACHLNAALIVWRYCLMGQHQLLLPLLLMGAGVDIDDTNKQLRQSLLRAFQELGDTSTSKTAAAAAAAAVDPSALYDQLQRSTTIRLEANDVGDSVTALCRLLQWAASSTVVVPKSTSTHSQQLPNYESLLHSGRVQSVLTGTKIGYKSRTKSLKERPLPNPFGLKLVAAAAGAEAKNHDACEIADLLRRAFLEEEPVESYQWPETRASDCATVGHWKTTRRQHLRRLPPIFMLHLGRFRPRKTADGRFRLEPTDGQQCWNVPAILDMSEYLAAENQSESTALNSTMNTFHLRGGILHVSEPGTKGDADDEEEGGHCVAVVCQNDQWFLVDDDRVETNISLERVLRWLGGAWYCCDGKKDDNSIPANAVKEVNGDDDDDGGGDDDDDDDDSGDRGVTAASYLRGLLLIYHCDDISTITDPLENMLTELRVKDFEDSTNTTQQQLIGRRLRVQWKGGKFYTGTVTAYNVDNGKHTVAYDDGDVREYRLAQKTIEWLPAAAANSE